ncbi:hypothetical protein PITC_053370 [Penicillium italicum]|uniref:Uncharacterized protein n=1 Tax=Penicillium italicum TaxID=40296 RepID=A0A0A2KJU8_PENIT|nr:hypothetical protein PITC_053370 [Penicillium italicum]
MPNENPACADCKAKKKRCIHRNQPVKVTVAEAVPANMPSPSDPVPPPVPTPAPTPAPVIAPGVATRGRRKAAEAEAKAKEMSSAPADSSDELSSVPSEAEQKPVVNKSTKRSRRANPAAEPQNRALNLAADNLQAASTMSVHRVWANQLQDDLQELERSMQAFNEAHGDTIAAAQAIQRTVEGWIQTWAVSGR